MTGVQTCALPISFAMLAFRYIKEGKVVDAKDHAPEYLRLSQAERERKGEHAAN